MKIETVEQLQALPIDTLLKDAQGRTVVLVPGLFKTHPVDVLWVFSYETYNKCSAGLVPGNFFPFTVLYRTGLLAEVWREGFDDAAVLASSDGPWDVANPYEED